VGYQLYYPLGYKCELDGLRACAVLPVLLFHGGMPGFGWGYVGVDLFFVISGYLITCILLKEHAQTGRVSLLDFYRRRALRLVPALAALCLAFLLYAALVLHNWNQGAKEVFVVAFYFGNWTRAFGMGLPHYLGHTWSLAVEEQFYMLWPLILPGVLALGARLASRALGFVLILIVVVTSWRVWLALQGATTDRLYNGTDTRADALLFGSALASGLAVPSFASRLTSAARYLWFPAIVIFIAVPHILPWNDRRLSFGGFSVVALAAATILIAVLNEGWLARILGNPALVWIGQRSYGLYLWHYPLTCVLQFQMHPGRRLSFVEVVCTFALAAFSYRFIEHPFLMRRYATGAVQR
jgi:peptidoglycan/LPS O-acetylase OafA/YrhL